MSMSKLMSTNCLCWDAWQEVVLARVVASCTALALGLQHYPQSSRKVGTTKLGRGRFGLRIAIIIVQIKYMKYRRPM